MTLRSLQANLHDKQRGCHAASVCREPALPVQDILVGKAESSDVGLRQTISVGAAPETIGKLAGHAADVAALSQHTSSPLRPALRPPVAMQRSPSRHHRRQLSTVTEEVQIQEEATPDTTEKPELPVLDLQPLMQQQVAYTGPQELYQSTAYTSDTTDIRTSATVSNLSDAAANQSNTFASQQQQFQPLDDDAESQATDTPPLINFTPPPRQAVAKLAKVFQPGPSRLSNASNDVTTSRAWSPLKHHAKTRQQTTDEDAADASRLAVGSGPRESHLDFFLRDAAAATANFRCASVRHLHCVAEHSQICIHWHALALCQCLYFFTSDK